MTYDILEDYDYPMPGESPMFTETLENLLAEDSSAGLASVDWNTSLFPNLANHKTRLVARFNQHYYYREIGAETVTKWNHFLQDRFDQIAPRFDHAYGLYDDENIDLDDLSLGYKRTTEYENEGSSSSSSSGSNDSKFKDTPTSGTSTVNNPTTETVDESEASAEGTSSGSSSGTENYESYNEYMMDRANRIIDHFKNLDEKFIDEFSEVFMGILTVM